MEFYRYYVTGLVIILFIVRIDASVRNREILQSSCGRYSTVSKTDTSAIRLLRRNSIAVDGENEERAQLSIPFQEKVKTFFSSSKITAEKLQEKLHGWLANDKPAEYVFTRLHLAKAGDYLFYKPEFANWVKYADDLSAKNPMVRMSAISTLTTRYGDDALYKMLVKASYSPDMKDLSTKLQNDQLKLWISTKKNPNEVFRLFKLDKTQDRLFRFPEFAVWLKYIDDFNAKHPGDRASMITTLTKHYRYNELIKMIETSKNVEGTRAIATRLEDELLLTWLRSGKRPDIALIDLGLGQAVSTLAERPQFTIWIKYMNVYYARYPDKTKMIDEFTKTLGDADATMILNAMKSQDTTKSIATELMSAQLNMWLNSGKSSQDVFNLLKLDNEGLFFRDNALFNTWLSYMNVFVIENPNMKPALFADLESRFSDRPLNKILNAANKFSSMESFTAKIQKEKIEYYLIGNESPGKVFELLALDDMGNDVLGTPLFQAWMNYVEVFNKRNPNRQESWFQPLRSNYGWGRVDGMIETAMKNPRTAKMGNMAQSAWLQQWMDWETSPKFAFQFLGLVEAKEQALVSPKFELWVQYLNDFNKRYPKEKTTMLDAINDNINVPKLMRVLEVAKKTPSTEKVAKHLEDALIEKWLATEMKPTYLSEWLGHTANGKELIDRYVKTLSRNTS